jgi:hypothetical protein
VNVTTNTANKLLHNHFLQIIVFYFCFEFLKGMRLDTFAAATGEGQLTAGDLSAGIGGSGLVQFLGDAKMLQVQYTAATAANVVDMGFGVAVKPFYAFHSAEAGNEPLLFEPRKIPVHRTQGKVGNLRLKLGVNPFCRGMLGGLAQAGQDGVAFAELFFCAFHSVSSCLSVFAYGLSIAQEILFVNRNYSHLEKFFRTDFQKIKNRGRQALKSVLYYTEIFLFLLSQIRRFFL